MTSYKNRRRAIVIGLLLINSPMLLSACGSDDDNPKMPNKFGLEEILVEQSPFGGWVIDHTQCGGIALPKGATQVCSVALNGELARSYEITLEDTRHYPTKFSYR